MSDLARCALELAEKATPGPWKADAGDSLAYGDSWAYVVGQVPEGRPGGEVIAEFKATNTSLRELVPHQDNVALAAFAREALPALAERVLALEEALREGDELFRWLEKHYPKALREYPTVKYQRLRLAALAAEEPA